MPKEGSEKLKSSAGEQVVRKHMEFQASLKSIRAGEKRHQQQEENIAEEKREARREDVKLALRLNADEKKTYEKAIREFMKEEGTGEKDKEILRVTIMEFIFDPLAFKENYTQWKADYANIPQLKKEKFPTLEAYIVNRSKDYIKDRRNDIVAARMRLFQSNNLKVSGDEPLDPEQEAQLKETTEKVYAFLDQHPDELFEYSNLPVDDPQRQMDGKLFQLFLNETFLGAGDQKQKELVFQLFQDVVGDFAASETAGKKLENAGAEMITMTDYAIDNDIDVEGDEWQEQWNTMLRDKEAQYLKEKPPEQKSFKVYQPAGTAETLPRDAILDTPERVALYAGLHVVGSAENGSYIVEFPGSDFRTTMRIVKKTDSKNFDDDEFVFDDHYADNTKGPEITLNKNNLRLECNRMFLDYIMNKRIIRKGESPNFNINDIFKDDTMIFMAEKFFGNNLNDIVLTQKNQDSFERFLRILMNGDPSTTPGVKDRNYPSFEDRVRVMTVIMTDDVHAQKIHRGCEEKSATVFTVSTLLEKLGIDKPLQY